MRLCMFHPNDTPMDRGWVGRLDGDRVAHLAAQTLQSFFLGGGGAREHAVYARAEVTLLVPVQYPPTVRVFDGEGVFRFANATAVVGSGVPIAGASPTACARVAAVIGAGGAIGGFSALLEWHQPAEAMPVKQTDFGLVLGPAVVTPDELDPATVAVVLRVDGEEQIALAPAPFAWSDAVALAARGTQLRPGDVIAGPPVLVREGVPTGAELEIAGVGILDCPLA